MFRYISLIANIVVYIGLIRAYSIEWYWALLIVAVLSLTNFIDGIEREQRF